MLKEILLDNSVYYLAITFTVSTLHSVFEWLAMKNGNKSFNLFHY